jgi:rubrerythrin
LAGQGFKEVYNLKGGINAWEGLKAAGPAELGLVLLRGDETPVEVISLAYGMEEGLRTFYAAISERIDDSAVVTVLAKLENVEVSHKQKLFKLYLNITENQETFERRVVSKTMEGGFTTEEYLEQNRSAIGTVTDILALAMMLETQALDLYLRYSQKSSDEKGRAVLYNIAEEEKAHLSTLGRLIEARA